MAEITTKTGYIVEFKDELDTNGYRAIQMVTLKQLRLRQGMTEDDISIGGDAALEAEEVALRHMVVSVTLPCGDKVTDPVKAIGEMPYRDGEQVYAKVNELTANEQEEEVKKEPATSSST